MGRKQRIGVARAFAGNAKVVVADEPVSALDVSVQAAVTELLMDIQRKNKTTMLFISHDLSVVRYIADRVVVMYLGYIVEQGTTDQIFSPPYHPYTEALLSAIPIADTSVVKKHIVLEGDIPSAMNPPTGCPFQTRCGYKKLVPGNLCETQVPPVKELGGGHKSLCWLDDDVLAKMEPVIKFDVEHAAHEGVPEDAPHGSGPGFVGERAEAAARQEGDSRGRRTRRRCRGGRSHASRARNHEHRDEISEPHPADPNSGLAPFAPRSVGRRTSERRRRRCVGVRADRGRERGKGEEDVVRTARGPDPQAAAFMLVILSEKSSTFRDQLYACRSQDLSCVA